MHDEGDPTADEHAKDAAHSAERNGLQRKLGEDGLFRGADRLADTYFASAFRDADQHDIHDADTANQQRHARQREEQKEQAAGDLIPEPGERIGPEDGEVIRRGVCDFSAATQQLCQLILHQRLVLLVVVLEADPVVQYLRMDLVEGCHGKERFIVFRVLPSAKRLFLFFHDTYDGKHHARDGDILAYRTRRAE